MLSTPPLHQVQVALDLRPGDRTPVHYTMKTHPRPSPALTNYHSHSHSHSMSQSSRTSKSNKSTTPAASPGAPYSVGQNYPPTFSPVRPSEPPEVRASSPNYFSMVVEPAHGPRESSGLIRGDSSPASSSIKSFAAALPKHVTLEFNPEFEALERQAGMNRGKSPATTSHHVQPTPSFPPIRPQPSRCHTHASDNGSDTSFTRTLDAMKGPPSSQMDVDQHSLHDSAYVSSDSKRSSEASIMPLQTTSMPKFESLQPVDHTQQRTSRSLVEDRDSRRSLMGHGPRLPSPRIPGLCRAATMPSRLDQPSMVSAEYLKVLIENVKEDSLMLLDMRAAQTFGVSRIKGALNLCVPTTLLKRANCNIEKLKTFQGSSEGEKFATWRDTEWIIVYDSSDKREPVAAQNMVKKFTNEGYPGNTGILRGGFSAFQSLYPQLIDTVPIVANGGTSPTSQKGGFAPVIGGVILPTVNTCNPFFANIRQNMELTNGVGQQNVSCPNGLEPLILPQWLREAASKPDHGKKVSDMFLRIEQEEQSRMQNAYAAITLGNACPSGKVQLSGVEKGGKNRYKDILPFEHARVKLKNRPEGSCDYVNASHLTAVGSNKRYIASQGPLPDTFEDFWTVIWEQDVRVIVMLTAESEGGQTKCHPYWEGHEFGPIKLEPLSEKRASLDIDKHRSGSQSGSISELNRRRAHTTTTVETTPNAQAMQGQTEAPYAIVRKFALSHSAYPFAPIREITHLHFQTWPDFGTPAQPSHLLALVELANVMQRAALPIETASIVGSSRAAGDALPMAWYDEPEADSASRPMLVHCSAGCGRTGSFCTVDSVIDMLKRQRLAKTSVGHAQPPGADFDEPVSPLTNTEMNFKFKLEPDYQSSLPKSKSEEHIDISWIHDDSIDLIQKTVEDFRGQRISMVQSLRQFVLCYETVLEWVNRAHDRGMTAPGGRRRSGSLHHA